MYLHPSQGGFPLSLIGGMWDRGSWGERSQKGGHAAARA